MIEKIYNILSYVIYIIAIFILIIMLPMLLVAFSNPIFLVSLFIFACIVIYSFVTFKFNKNTVQSKLSSSKTIKAWININGFITGIFAFQLLFGAYLVFQSPHQTMLQVDSFYNQFSTMTKVTLPSKDIMHNMMKAMIIVYCIYGIILLSHVIMSFYLMKKYKGLFT